MPRPGAHINAVGSYTPGACEVNAKTVARTWVVVDDLATLFKSVGVAVQDAIAASQHWRQAISVVWARWLLGRVVS